MSSTTVGTPGASLAADVRGDGPAVVFVHGTGLGRALWNETVAALDGAGLRTVAYDRRGYGASEAPEPYSGTTVGEQADDLAVVIEGLDAAPALLVGHGLGALIALDVLLHRSDLVRGGVLIEPPLLYLSPRGPEVVGEQRDAIEVGAREGGPAGAVDGYLEYVAGQDALAALGPDRMNAARTDSIAFAADLAAGPTWGATRRQLRALELPVTLVVGSRASAVATEIVSDLDRMLPRSSVVVPQGGHLVPVEAPADVAAAVRALA